MTYLNEEKLETEEEAAPEVATEEEKVAEGEENA